MKRKKHTIWQSQFDVDDYTEFLKQEYPEVCLDGDEAFLIVSELIAQNLDDERENLSIPCENGIIKFGTLGRWNGTFHGYDRRELHKISDCLYYREDDADIYVNEYGDLVMDEYHHDGVNHYCFREWKEGITESQKDNFRNALLNGDVSRQKISYYTRSLGEKICNVYGW